MCMQYLTLCFSPSFCLLCICMSGGSQKRENTVSGKFQFSLNSGELVLKESKDSKALLSGVITGD